MIMNVIIFPQYLNFCNEWWYMLQFEALNQIKYLQPISFSKKKKKKNLQPSTMKII